MSHRLILADENDGCDASKTLTATDSVSSVSDGAQVPRRYSGAVDLDDGDVDDLRTVASEDVDVDDDDDGLRAWQVSTATDLCWAGFQPL